jgi:cardiolipin synthase
MVQGGLVARVLLRPHREPASRIAWIVILLAFPVVGILAYLLLGETNIGRRRMEQMQEILAVSPPEKAEPMPEVPPAVDLADGYAHLFRLGKTVNGFDPVAGNRGHLLKDSDAAVDAMVADIDRAVDHVHVLFYIWLPDRNGCKVVEALRRAAKRGVACRVMADSLGSRRMIHSEHWRAMGEAGVRLSAALAVGNPLLRPLQRRIDLRNHRKILAVDHRIAYCGSQNCADPAFLVKARYAPWVDITVRFEGPVVQQLQLLFAGDWMAETGEDLGPSVLRAIPAAAQGFPAQVIGTGPTPGHSAMPEVFASLMYAARRELVISTPYYVPNEAMQAALCAAGRRGVETTLVLPARNDSWIVAAASRSYYAELLTAGVRIFEYVGGLLHAKTLTLDGEMTLIGSANMDRRSFDLNFEDNVLFVDRALTGEVRRRQETYIDSAGPVTAETVAQWSWRRRLWNNAVGMLGPVL